METSTYSNTRKQLEIRIFSFIIFHESVKRVDSFYQKLLHPLISHFPRAMRGKLKFLLDSSFSQSFKQQMDSENRSIIISETELAKVNQSFNSVEMKIWEFLHMKAIRVHEKRGMTRQFPGNVPLNENQRRSF